MEGEGGRRRREVGGDFPQLISVSDELQHLMLHPHTLVYMIAHLYMLSFAQVICESCNCRDLDLCRILSKFIISLLTGLFVGRGQG